MAAARWPGPALILAGAGFLIIEALAATASMSLGYSYARNFISQLQLAPYPYGVAMSTAFVLNGVLTVAAAVALRRRQPPGAGRGVLLALALTYGFGIVLAGIFRGDIAPQVHSIGAGLCILAGNLALLTAAWLLHRRGRTTVALALGLLGLLGLTGTVLMLTVALPDDAGVAERIAVYPNLLGQVAIGIGTVPSRDRLMHKGIPHTNR
ncbi:DUF998 domain-containing protein [Mycobacterium hackensackense]|uniref:DUF998 domain-containing protein n=1 Tax=Mycobacterium hackensackense TaxID=228909 RepID=UPI002265C1DC|nr:DUF998 domain-containing protein [Mycobacterium hackensackense]MCV7250922.1 DUF998 domain-containing protein [Mycobacterium hackensackense]